MRLDVLLLWLCCYLLLVMLLLDVLLFLLYVVWQPALKLEHFRNKKRNIFCEMISFWFGNAL